MSLRLLKALNQVAGPVAAPLDVDPEVIVAALEQATPEEREATLRLFGFSEGPSELEAISDPETRARREAVDRSLSAAIETLDTPARWVALLHRKDALPAIRAELDQHLAETERSFTKLTDTQRAAIVAPYVEAFVSKYRGWLSSSALALGILPPLVVGYLIGWAPSTLAVLLSFSAQKFIGPAGFQLDMKVNAWVKKLTYQNSEKREDAKVETPYQLWAAKVVDKQNANIRDVPRDGVSIAKDALLFLSAHLAELPSDRQLAISSFARAILLQVEGYPQAIELDEDEAAILRNRFHERFGDDESYGAIKAELEKRAAIRKVNFDVALLLLDQILGPRGA